MPRAKPRTDHKVLLEGFVLSDTAVQELKSLCPGKNWKKEFLECMTEITSQLSYWWRLSQINPSYGEGTAALEAIHRHAEALSVLFAGSIGYGALGRLTAHHETNPNEQFEYTMKVKHTCEQLSEDALIALDTKRKVPNAASLRTSAKVRAARQVAKLLIAHRIDATRTFSYDDGSPASLYTKLVQWVLVNANPNTDGKGVGDINNITKLAIG